MNKTVLLINNAKGTGQSKMTNHLKRFLNKKGYSIIEVSESNDWHPIQKKLDKIKILGIILSGSDIRLTQKTQLKKYKNNITALINYPEVPVLGICFGIQIMSAVYGGKLDSLSAPIKGWKSISCKKGLLFPKATRHYRVYENHQDYVVSAPPGFAVTAVNSLGYIEAMENTTALRFGVQFHPEYQPEKFNCQIIERFIEFCHSMSS